jgi:hypothetical protein
VIRAAPTLAAVTRPVAGSTAATFAAPEAQLTGRVTLAFAGPSGVAVRASVWPTSSVTGCAPTSAPPVRVTRTLATSTNDTEAAAVPPPRTVYGPTNAESSVRPPACSATAALTTHTALAPVPWSAPLRCVSAKQDARSTVKGSVCAAAPVRAPVCGASATRSPDARS